MFFILPPLPPTGFVSLAKEAFKWLFAGGASAASASATACLSGIFAYIALKNSMDGKNRHGKKALSDRSIRIMSVFFPSLDLYSVKIRENSVFDNLIPQNADAFTIGDTIFFRGELRECALSKDAVAEQDWFEINMKLLMHELVHIDQIRRKGWRKFACEYALGATVEEVSITQNPLEREAYDFANKHEDDLFGLLEKECAIERMQRQRQNSDWFWLLWGSA